MRSQLNLIAENVRCFYGKHIVPIRPLTLLVGENSSGKSSLLAMISALSDPRSFPFQPRFNDPPYSLGGFSTIATHGSRYVQQRKAKAGGISSFSIGFLNALSDSGTAETVASYGNDRGEAVLIDLKVKSPKGTVSATRKPPGNFKVCLSGPGLADFSFEMQSVFDSRPGLEPSEGGFHMLYRELVADEADKIHSDQHVFARRIRRIIAQLELPPPTISIGPTRMRPQRTYDRVTEDFTPEGNQIPFVLARMLSDTNDPGTRRSFLAAFKRFGVESGLLTDIAIRSLGDTPGDPFQVMIAVAGRPATLVDVGYGVSQALPVVVQSILAASDKMLLIQQPEVHLHPRAQAALGSFFVEIVAKANKRLVVETHSDYIIDRIRQDIAAGKIDAEDVVFLYLERRGFKTKVFPLTTDELGNLNGAPPSYREFFLRETMNLLGRGE